MPDEQPPISPPPPPPAPFGGAAYAAPRMPPFAQAPPAGYPPPYGYQPQYGAPRASRSASFWIASVGGTVAVVLAAVFLFGWAVTKTINAGDDSGTSIGSGSQIGVIDISGVITDPEKVDASLRKFGDDDSIKAILLHIDSPGGGAAASQEVYHEVMRVRREKHKKIVADIESTGASGAYYIASACDRIYANQASVVGSIGVIMEWTNYGDLMHWAKLKSVVIHAGELKDAGDPTRDLTPKEEAYFQSLVDNMYTQFVQDVATGRHTTADKIRPLATGQVWTGEQALGLGLIDQQGGYREALMDTAKSVGISGEPSVTKPSKEKKGLLSILTSDSDELFPNPSQMLNRAPGFYFMWK